MDRRIIRTGEYSPNNGSYLGSGCIFLGIGEYEEKKKYYENQRKLECKQYLTQQAQKCSTVKIKNGPRTPVIVKTDTAILSSPKIDTPRNHAATQTISRLMQDASTYTELDKSELVQNGDSIKESFVMPIRKQNEDVMPRNISNDKKNHSSGLSSIRTLSPGKKGTRVQSALNGEFLKPVPHLVKAGVLTDILNQNRNDIGDQELNTKNTRRRWITSATSYAGDLNAQVEEKRKIKRELEEKEKREELARDKWVMEDDERHKEELKKHKAKKDTVKEDIVTDTLNQNANIIGELELSTDNARRRWIDNAASYAGDLRAQVEEKNKIRKELKEKEKQEELARDKWVMEDDERHKEELDKSKARKDTHQKAMEEFSRCQEHNWNGEQEKTKDYEEQRKLDFKQYLTQQHQETMGDLSHHQEQIRKDNEERRISGTRERVSESPKDTLGSLGSDIGGIGNSSKEDDSVQLNQNPKRSSNKSFKNDLMPCKGSDIFRNSNNLDAQVEERQHLTRGKSTGGTRVSSGGSLTARECQSKNMKRSVCKPLSARLSENSPLSSRKPLPKSTFLADNLGKEEMLSHSIEEKVPGKKILCNLGFLRKQFEIDQRRMLKNAAK